MQNDVINLEHVRLLSEGVDQTGYVFEYEGKIYRAIANEHISRMKKIINSGLFEELEKNNLIVKTSVSKKKFGTNGLLLESQLIEPVIYPYEWTFSLLKDAAITVLHIQKIADQYGFQLVDTHPFNFLFHDGYIKCIDIGSFEEKNSSGWKGYTDFKESFYYPLKLWSAGNSNLARGVLFTGPRRIQTYQYMLYRYPILRSLRIRKLQQLLQYYPYFEIIYTIPRHKIKAYPNKFLSSLAVTLLDKKIIPQINSTGSIAKLQKQVTQIRSPQAITEWDSYYTLMEDHLDDLKRFDQVIDIIKTLHGSKSLVDLAGNEGYFCKRILKETTITKTVCIDGDENAIDRLYNDIKNNRALSIAPVMNNFMQPNGTLREMPPHKRFKSDIVTSFGVTHHLMLGQGHTISEVLSTIKSYTRKFAVVEFMPKGVYGTMNDYKKILPHWYTESWFKDNFMKHFDLIGQKKLNEDRIVFWGEVKK